MTKQLTLFGEPEEQKTIQQSAAPIISGPIPDQTGYRHQLEINTLESAGDCRACGKWVEVYKRQYHDYHTGRNVQSYYISPCDCRAEYFDEYQHRNEETGRIV